MLIIKETNFFILFVELDIRSGYVSLAGDCLCLTWKEREEVVAPICRNDHIALRILGFEDVHI